MENLITAYFAVGVSSAIMTSYLVLIPALKQAKPSAGIGILYFTIFNIGVLIAYPLVMWGVFKDTKYSIKVTKNSIIRTINQC